MIIVTIGNTGAANQRWSIQNTATNAVGAQAFDTTSNSTNSTAVVADANWHLYVCTFNSDDTTKKATLDNNVPISGGALRSPVMTTPCVRISGTPNGTLVFTGLVAHVAMWDAVLNATEITALYTQTPNYVKTSNLREYWPLNGSSPEPSFGTVGTSLTVTGTTYTTDDPFGPVLLMGQAML